MIVVDASVWVSFLMPRDVNHDVSLRWLERWIMQQRIVVEPLLLLAEVAGAVSRRTGEVMLAHRITAEFQRLPVLRLIALDDDLATESARLAADLQLRGADAVYVAVAHRLGIPLVTWDREQLDRANGIVSVRSLGYGWSSMS